MNGRPSNKSVVTAVVLTACAGLGAYTAVWQPRAAEAEDLRRNQAEITASIAQVRQLEDTAAAAQADAGALEAQAAAALAAIPASADLDGLVAAHRDAAGVAGVSELEVAPDPTPTDGGVPGLYAQLVRVSVRGDAASIRDYVHRMESLPRLVVVDAMRSAVEGGGQVTVSLTLRAFHSGSAAPTAIVAVPAPAPGDAGPVPEG
jgi:Tfp pilus assembly protein PilO